MRYFLRLVYDGTPFHGWQRQPNAASVQQKIEEALSTIFQRPTDITGAGRTDTGVHAAEMYAHFDTDAIADSGRFLTSLNRLVGNEIAIDALLPVKPDAHARFDALSRSYKYHVTLRKNPFAFRYAHRMDRMPCVEAMNEAADILLTTEDFTSFAKLHTDVKTNICRVTEARWTVDEESRELVFTITADRFLRNMVRAVVGTLLEVGTGKVTLQGFREIIEKKDRCEAGTSMPAKGLFLQKIVYPKEIFI